MQTVSKLLCGKYKAGGGCVVRLVVHLWHVSITNSIYGCTSVKMGSVTMTLSIHITVIDVVKGSLPLQVCEIT